MKTLTIGQVATRAGVGIETVRYYERRGLLQEPSRRASGYRAYTEDAIERLRFVRRAKDLGFTLEEIRELLDLRSAPDARRADIRKRARTKLTAIESKIHDLTAMRNSLESLIAVCHGDGSAKSCPIMLALDEPNSLHSA